MARNSFPMTKTGGGMLSKVVGALVTLAILAFVVKHPVDAAHLTSGAFTMLANAIDGFASFFSQIKW